MTSDLATAIHSTRALNLWGAMACAALLGYALFAQHVLGYEPCPLCILQRVAVLVLGLVFLAAAAHGPGARHARLYTVLIVVVTLIGALIAWRHLWIIAQPPGTVAACGASLDYMLEVLPLREVLTTVLSGSGECASVDWRLLGFTMPAWVLLSFVVLGAYGAAVNLGRSTTR